MIWTINIMARERGEHSQPDCPFRYKTQQAGMWINFISYNRLNILRVFVLWSELNFSSVLPVGNISHKFDNSIMCCLVAIVCIVSGRIWECYRSDNTSSCINTIQSQSAEIRNWGVGTVLALLVTTLWGDTTAPPSLHSSVLRTTYVFYFIQKGLPGGESNGRQ